MGKIIFNWISYHYYDLIAISLAIFVKSFPLLLILFYMLYRCISYVLKVCIKYQSLLYFMNIFLKALLSYFNYKYLHLTWHLCKTVLTGQQGTVHCSRRTQHHPSLTSQASWEPCSQGWAEDWSGRQGNSMKGRVCKEQPEGSQF